METENNSERNSIVPEEVWDNVKIIARILESSQKAFTPIEVAMAMHVYSAMVFGTLSQKGGVEDEEGVLGSMHNIFKEVYYYISALGAN